MSYQSIIERRNSVPFPEFASERIYMERITNGILPKQFSRWQNTVDAMISSLPTIPSVMFLMVDEKAVVKGQASRRIGPHVDGYWIDGHTEHEDSGAHSGGDITPRSHGDTPYWNDKPGPIYTPPVVPVKNPSHRKIVPEKPQEPSPFQEPKWPTDLKRPWTNATFSHPEAILLSSNIEGARAFTGKCYGGLGIMGDASKVNLSGMDMVPMKSGYCYVGNVGTLHESIGVMEDCKRQVIRLNIPNCLA